jgi:hypothetical protein
MRKALIACALLTVTLLLFDCSGFEKKTVTIAGGRDVEEPSSQRPRRRGEFLEIENSYDLESLLLPVLRYNNLVLSFDFYPQFVLEGDFVFPEYMHRVFGAERSPYRSGEGIILVAGYEDMGIDLRLEQSLLGMDEGGSWWRIDQTYLDQRIRYEVLVSDAGVPRLIRYADPKTGALRESVPDYSEAYETPSGDSDPDALNRLDLQRRERFEKEWSYAFNRPRIVGEELIETVAGRFMTVHVHDAYDDEDLSSADFWISPDVPGNIVRIRYNSPGQPAYVVELLELTTGNTPVPPVSDERS